MYMMTEWVEKTLDHAVEDLLMTMNQIHKNIDDKLDSDDLDTYKCCVHLLTDISDYVRNNRYHTAEVTKPS